MTKSRNRQWHQRQQRDIFVRRARDDGYRSRAAFKLLAIDKKYRVFSPGVTVIDLGAAPGAWCQVAKQRGAGTVIGCDLLAMTPLNGVTFIQGDFLDEAVRARIQAAAGGPCAVVLSDMAPNLTGIAVRDAAQSLALLTQAVDFAATMLQKNGVFVGKFFYGGEDNDALTVCRRAFSSVTISKPPASRTSSSEAYLVCRP